MSTVDELRSDIYTTDAFSRQYGSLFDRGRADSYYQRGRNPHWYPHGSGSQPRVTELSEAEIAEYNAGFDANEAEFFFKEWD